MAHPSEGHQRRKSYDEVFDRQNVMRIYKLFTDGVIDRLDFPISTGKEGNVFRASTKSSEFVAVKIYRSSTSTFGDMAKYVLGDPRFKGLMGRKRKLIYAWANKEFLNLKLFQNAGVRVPRPILHVSYIVVMEYIGDQDAPAKQMRNVRLDDPEAVARKILGYVRLAYQKVELVHSDLSEFNVLMLGDEPVGLVIARIYTPVMLIVVLALRTLRQIWPMFKAPKPAEKLEGYPDVWPNYFVSGAFVHDRTFGLWFLLGLIVDTIIKAVFR